MEHLIGNGTHLYRRNSHLVRTPIHIALQASEMAWYAVAGGYDSGDQPTHGYLDSMTYNNTIALGSTCIYDSLNPNNHMYWRQVTNAHHPETAWYQGAYGTSASSMNLAKTSSEAYMQFCAYRFTIPPTLADLNVKNVTVKFVNGGGVLCYGPAYNRSSNNRALNSLGGTWSSYYIPFYVSEYTNTQVPIRNPLIIARDYPYDAPIDILADGGGFIGDRNLWNFNSSTRDGGIPALTTQPTKSYNMGQYTLAFVNTYRDFWITPIIDREWTNATTYRPLYVSTTGGWWGCFSLWDISIEIDVGGYD